jgi:hypothetical protein
MKPSNILEVTFHDMPSRPDQLCFIHPFIRPPVQDEFVLRMWSFTAPNQCDMDEEDTAYMEEMRLEICNMDAVQKVTYGRSPK